MLSRLYVWSVVLEPLAFFVLFDRRFSGVTGNVSRLLQAIVVGGLALSASARLLGDERSPYRLPNLRHHLYRYYALYLGFAVVAGLVGWLRGAYALPGGFESDVPETAVSRMLNSAAIRPLFEYVIAVYYFAYFAVFPQYLLRTPKQVDYFFRVFRRMFVLSFVVGVVDLAGSALNRPLLPRHIADWGDWRTVGVRFHGLAGEPRQAFVYLVCGLAVLYVGSVLRGRRLPRAWVLAIFAAVAATQSASGMLGIVCFLGLLTLHGMSRLSPAAIVRTLILAVIVGALLWSAAVNSERIMQYVESASGIWHVLESGGELPPLMAVQYNDIYPLYDLTVKARDLDLVPVLIGSGLGSSSLANSRLEGTREFANPNSQFVRIVYESGLVGLFLFVMAFVHPVSHLTRHAAPRLRRNVMIFMLLAVGVCLGVRNSMVFVLLGSIIAAVRTHGHCFVRPAGSGQPGTSPSGLPSALGSAGAVSAGVALRPQGAGRL